MTHIDNQLNGKRVLVTGATGFVGGRLAERLAREEGADVVGTGRDLAKGDWLTAYGVRLAQADLGRPETFGPLIDAADVVIHCAAYMGNSNEALGQALNIDATEWIVRRAAAAGVQRVVVVSSIAAYGRSPVDWVDEDVPVQVDQPEVYGRTKAIGEQTALALGRELGVEVTVVRPGMVYGPRAEAWTIRLVKLIQRGVPVLFGRGDGYAAIAYIDNVVDMLLLAATHPAAAGEAFNATDEPVTWNTFLGSYASMTGKKLRRRLPYPVAWFFAWLIEVTRLKIPLSRSRLRVYLQKQVYPMAKAERLLGRVQRVPYAQGMAETEPWLRTEGYL